MAAGEEDQRCQFIVAPPEGLKINKVQVRNGIGSHHMFVWKTLYPTIPTVNVRGETVDTSGVIKCSNGVSADWNVDAIVAGGQSASQDTVMPPLPDGVALNIPGGTVLVMFGHFVNPQDAPVVADMRVNFYTVPNEAVTQDAAIYVLYNPFIRVGPMSTANARMSCPIPADVNILGAQSHMHARGMGEDATLVGPDGTREPLYQSSSWDDVPDKQWRPALFAKAGSAIDFTCHYTNTENRVVTQGQSNNDEMCVITGFYYPVNMPFANCSPDGRADNFSEAATFIGSGTVSCAQTLGCIATAQPVSADHGDSLFGCMVNSCPAVAKPLTAAFLCLAGHGGAACATACQGDTSSTQCKQCVQTTCAPATSACVAAQC